MRPDDFARVEDAGGSLELPLELDFGTEIRSRLEKKMERDRVLARAATAPDVVLGGIVLAARLAQRSHRHHDPRRRMPLMG